MFSKFNKKTIESITLIADDGDSIQSTNGSFSTTIAGGAGIASTVSGGKIVFTPVASSDGAKGIVELATTAEADTGTDTARAVTSAGVKSHFESRKVHELTAPTSALAMNSQKITGLDTPTSAGDAATKAYVDGRSSRVYGNTIKILPSDFMANEEAGVNPSLQYVDNTGNGIKPGHNDIELLAFVDIPEGKKATHVDVYMDSNEAIEVFDVDIHQAGITSKGSGNANTQLDITDVNSTATNFLMIRITTLNKTDRVWGGLITIADQ